MNDIHSRKPLAVAGRDAVTAIVVFVLAAIWLVTIAGGRPGYGFDGVTALHAAQNIAEGEGFSFKGFAPGDARLAPQSSITKPPLYPVLTAVLMAFGVAHEYAAWIVSGAAWAMTAALLFTIARQGLPVIPALIVPLLYVTHVTSLRWGITVHEQALFVGLSVATLWRLTHVARFAAAIHWGQYGLLGILAALAMIASYQGFPLLVTATLFAMVASWRERALSKFAAYVGGVVMIGAWPLVRFVSLWADGVRPGFASSDSTTYYGILAGILSAFQNDMFGRLVVWLYDGSWSDVVVVVGSYVFLAALLALIGWKRPGWRPLAAFVVLYLSILVVRLGAAGVPGFEPRVNTPIYGVLFLFVVYAAYQLSRAWPRLKTVLSVLALGAAVMLIQVQVGRYPTLLRGHGEMCHIPATISWIQSHVPRGAPIATTQCGYQIQASTNDYYLHLIPPAGDIDTPMRWTEGDFIRACPSVDTLWIVVFDGRSEGRYLDAFVDAPGYGEFVTGLLSGVPGKRLERVARTSEGVIYKLDCRPEAGRAG